MAIGCSKQELFEITDKKQPAAQVRVLRAMGIEHRQRPNGTVFVLRSHVDHLLGAPEAKRPDDSEWDHRESA